MSGKSQLPLVAIYSLGGTIASPAGQGGAVPGLDAADLTAAVPGIDEVARLEAIPFRRVPSPEIALPDLIKLVAEAHAQVAAGAAGVVVTQGTDSLEESSFALDLLWDCGQPLVMTGAMRIPTLAGADGPANLLAAVRAAAASDTRGLGCLVAFNDELHAARFVQKTHTSNPATFRSRLAGPIGWISEGRIRVALRPVGRHHIRPGPGPVPPVALVRVGLGDDGRLLTAVLERGFAGLVVEAMGGGHLPASTLPCLEEAARHLPVVLASRTGSGELLTSTYGFPGSEQDLLGRGLIAAGALDGLKARLLLTLLLMAGAGRDEISAGFHKVGIPGHGDFRLVADDA